VHREIEEFEEIRLGQVRAERRKVDLRGRGRSGMSAASIRWVRKITSEKSVPD
jgi:hypothetical protein